MRLIKPKSTKIITFILAFILTFGNIPALSLSLNASAEDVIYFVGTNEFNDLSTIVPSWRFNTVPSNYSCVGGTNVVLSIDVTDNEGGTPEYQWYLDDEVIGNATGNILTIKNISVLYKGNYIVDVTINDVTVKIGCVVDVIGGDVGKTEFITSNSNKPEEPETEELNYNIIEITDNYGRVLKEYNTDDLQIKDNKLIVDIDTAAGYRCTIYTKKLDELARRYRNGVLTLRFPGSKNLSEQPSLDVPFDIAQNAAYTKSGDYRLIISVKELSALSMESKLKRTYSNLLNVGNFYEISLEVPEYSNSEVKAAIPDDNFASVHLNLPVNNLDFIAVAYNSDSGKAYAIPVALKNNFVRFSIRNNSGYGTIKMDAKFKDIDNHWAKDDIIKAANMLLVEGKSGSAYIPQADVTRAEFCTMLVRLVAYADIGMADTANESKSIYSDVAKGSWYYDYVQTAQKIGLLDFVSDNSFEPNEPILREEMAYMTARALQYAGIDTRQYNSVGTIKFEDASEVNSKFLRDVAICVNAGILKGMNDNGEMKFMPKKTHIRAEAAVVMNRIIDFIK